MTSNLIGWKLEVGMHINLFSMSRANKRQKDFVWKQTTHYKNTDKKIEVSVLLRLFISSNKVCNTAYAL